MTQIHRIRTHPDSPGPERREDQSILSNMATNGKNPSAVLKTADRPRPIESLGPDLATGIYPQFLMFGDSITQIGCGELQPTLQTFYIRKVDVLNRGFSGYTTAQAKQTIQHFIPPNTPSPSSFSQDPAATIPVPEIKLMTIFFGANDACLPRFPQHVPIDEFKANIEAIIDYPPLKRHRTKILLITPPPVNEYQLGTPLTRTALNTAHYAACIKQIAKTRGLPCVDIWSTFMRQCGWSQPPPFASASASASASVSVDKTHIELEIPGSLHLPPSEALQQLLIDGLHLTSLGYKALYKEIVATIKSDAPECLPENLPIINKLWRDCYEGGVPPFPTT